MTVSVVWEQARHMAYCSAPPLSAVQVGLEAAIGCVLAEDLTARTDLPPADTSAMDGWAVCGAPPWTVAGQSLAGHGPGQAVLQRSQAMVIATGAALPTGATGIVRTEHGLLDGVILRPGDLAANPPNLADLRPRGHEAVAGEVLLTAGARIRPPVVGLAAAAGHDLLAVHPRPRVELLVLGDELLDSGLPRGGAVRDALGVQLPAWVSALGGEPVGAFRIPDDEAATAAAVRSGEGSAEVLVTTGGSAGGSADHLRRTLAELGARITVDTVDVRPGHPMLLAELPDGRRLVGLPGNPLAALAGVLTLLGPLLAGLGGARLPPIGEATVEVEVPIMPQGRRSRGHLLIPVFRGADGGVRPTGYAASAMLRGVALADGFLLVPPTGLSTGQRAGVVWFPWTSALSPEP